MNQSSREPTTRLLTQLVLSLLRDVLIPFVYTFMVGPLSTCIQSREVNQLLSYPIRWPIIILQNLIPYVLRVLSTEPIVMDVVDRFTAEHNNRSAYVQHPRHAQGNYLERYELNPTSHLTHWSDSVLASARQLSVSVQDIAGRHPSRRE